MPQVNLSFLTGGESTLHFTWRAADFRRPKIVCLCHILVHLWIFYQEYGGLLIHMNKGNHLFDLNRYELRHIIPSYPRV
jgi:hypothetical protein